MKKIYLFLTFLSLSFCSLAQSWTPHANGSDLYFTGGKAGIGFSSPAYKLDVNGTGRFKGSVQFETPQSIGFESDPTYGAHHWITYNDGGGNFNLRVGNKYVSGAHTITETGHAFQTIWTQSSGNIRWRISQNGAAGSTASFRELFNIDYDYGFVANEGGVPNLNFRVEGDTDTHLLFIDASEDVVGIGTSTPFSKLHVNNTEEVGINITGNTSAFVGCDICVQRSSTATGVGRGATLQFGDLGTGDANIIQGSTGGLQFFNNYNGSGWSEQMRITTDGKVGIGTTSPSDLLHISSSTSGDAVLKVEADTDNNNENDNSWIELKQDGGGLGAYLGFNGDWGGGGGSQGAEPDNLFRIGTRYSGVDNFSRFVINGYNGNVGIGSSSPDAKLHVFGNNAGDGNPLASIMIGKSNGAEIEAIQEGNDDDRHSLAFRVKQSQTAADPNFEAMRIKFDGNVGVGTTSPASRLHVAESGNTYLQLENTATNGSTVKFGPVSSNGYVETQLRFEGEFGLFDHTPGVNAWRLKVLDNGNVGIGKSNPSYALDVVGQARATDFYRLTNVGSGGDGIIADDGAGSTIFSIRRNAGNEIRFQGYGDITFFNNGSSGSEKMRITNDGKVGIGTTTVPSGYKLAVDGKVITEEVKVELSGSWPDYVFEDDYNLQSLEEIEKFIKSNNHLPEVPSARDIEENGVKLGAMNALLLKKIEELTLYMIMQQKQIKQLTNKNSVINAELDELRNNISTK